MKIEDVCKKIYELSLPIAEKSIAPIAYINVLKGTSSPFDDISLYQEFNRIKWNTKLSTSELAFTITELEPTILRVLSLSEFEDENGTSISHNISASSGTIIS